MQNSWGTSFFTNTPVDYSDGTFWAAYDAARRERGVLDNEDLQAEALRLLETCPGVLLRCRHRYYKELYILLKMQSKNLDHMVQNEDVYNKSCFVERFLTDYNWRLTLQQ